MPTGLPSAIDVLVTSQGINGGSNGEGEMDARATGSLRRGRLGARTRRAGQVRGRCRAPRRGSRLGWRRGSGRRGASRQRQGEGAVGWPQGSWRGRGALGWQGRLAAKRSGRGAVDGSTVGSWVRSVGAELARRGWTGGCRSSWRHARGCKGRQGEREYGRGRQRATTAWRRARGRRLGG
jgi:hypothetical protein